MAAEQGHITAPYNMGRLSAHGRGVVHSDVESAKWFRQAASLASLVNTPQKQRNTPVQCSTVSSG